MRGVWCAFMLVILGCQPKSPEAEQEITQTTSSPEIAAPGEEQEPPSKVYYKQLNVGSLTPVPVNLIRHPDATVRAKHLIDLLSIQPEDPGFAPIWPSNTFVREVFLLPDGTIVVDFDERFVDSLSAGVSLEEQMIVSLTLTLLDNFETFQWVRILVGGMPRETFLGHVDIERALSRKTKVYTVVPGESVEDQISVEDLDSDLSEQPPQNPSPEPQKAERQ